MDTNNTDPGREKPPVAVFEKTCATTAKKRKKVMFILDFEKSIKTYV